MATEATLTRWGTSCFSSAQAGITFLASELLPGPSAVVRLSFQL